MLPHFMKTAVDEDGNDARTVLLATEPIVFCLSLWISFAWGTLYLFLESVPLVFAQYGIAQGPSFVGLAIGALVGFAIHLVYVHRSKRLAGSTPETRLGEACVGAVAFAASEFPPPSCLFCLTCQR